MRRQLITPFANAEVLRGLALAITAHDEMTAARRAGIDVPTTIDPESDIERARAWVRHATELRKHNHRPTHTRNTP
jgi:hypothetical protein